MIFNEEKIRNGNIVCDYSSFVPVRLEPDGVGHNGGNQKISFIHEYVMRSKRALGQKCRCIAVSFRDKSVKKSRSIIIPKIILSQGQVKVKI